MSTRPVLGRAGPGAALGALRGALLAAACLALIGPSRAADAPAPPPAAIAAPAPPAAAAALPTEDIRDIRGPKFIVPMALILALVAGGLLLAAGVYLLVRKLRRPRPPRALLSFERALQRLEALRPLLQPDRAREFSIAASDIVRTYIEERFDVVATHQTTEEFLHALVQPAHAAQASHAALARHRPLLGEFLEQCDLVKFAGASLTAHNMHALHDSARAFVLETAQPEPPPAATARAAA